MLITAYHAGTAFKPGRGQCWSKRIGVKFPEVTELNMLVSRGINTVRIFVGIPIAFARPEAHRGGKPNTTICGAVF